MMIGQTIGPFEIESELGSGAMGTVYKARYTKDGKVFPIALKIVSFGLLGNESAMARFDREAAILKQLRHPHIVRMVGSGRYQKTPFIAMEFVDGKSLEQILADRKRLNWEDVINYGKQLCSALQHAHDKGIIHRDLKPSNLMVTKDGVLKLTDFGIAKDTDVTALTGANSTIGTAAYMSPEQCKGDRNLSAKSDLYSLGIVLYELITGRKPYTAESTVDMFLKHVNEKPVRPSKLVPDLPIWLDNLILFLMEKNKEMRPLDAAKVGVLLGEIEGKVQAQQSVGAEVANARRMDRQDGSNPVDDADKDVARSLRSGKKKKKKKGKPWYAAAWLKAVPLIVVLLGLVGLAAYLLKPEGLDAAHARVEAAPADAKLEALVAFLNAHGTKPDPRVEKAWAQYREVRVRRVEDILSKRYNTKFRGNSEGFDEDAFKASMQAMDAEREGKPKPAIDLWSVARDKSPSGEANKIPEEDESNKVTLKWVAEKRIRILQTDVPEKLRAIRKQIADESGFDTIKTYEAGNPEAAAVRGLRLEKYGDSAKAKGIWEDLITKSEKDLDLHLWFLIAAQQSGQITLEKGKADEARAARIKKLEDRMKEIDEAWDKIKDDPDARVPRRDIRGSCREIIAMYDDEPNEAVKAVVTRAEKILKAAAK